MYPLFNMTGRSPTEHHRAATPLELLFDLVFVVAIARAAAELHHGFIEHHSISATLSFLMVFFAIWWAWMGFTWLASAFDVDDAPYRLLVLVQMFGSLIIAAGVPDAFAYDWKKMTLGYCIMRLGLIGLWLRVAYSHPKNTPTHATAMRYVVGIVICQMGWIGILFIPSTLFNTSLPVGIALFGLMVVFELLVPIWARKVGRTPWHAGHIAERYSLLTLIVLGESILSVSLALQATGSLNDISWDMMIFLISSVITLFTMWWLYFHEPAHTLLHKSDKIAFLWGYGHYFIFAAVAAVGAALAAHVDILTGKASMDNLQQGLTITLPLATYLCGLWYCHERLRLQSPAEKLAYPITAGIVVLSSLLPYTLFWSMLTLVGLLVWRLKLNREKSNRLVDGQEV